MNNASKMKIICDPFKKEIKYQWYDFNIEDYVGFDPENSKLASKEFTNATIQNRAYEIVDVINSECNVGNVGLEIIFVGTKDDYSDFCDIISSYYGESNISCICDEYYYNSADFVMPRIKEKFSAIKIMFEECKEDGEITKLIGKYNDAVKPSISLCMMGLYSAGKSAFINSIIGAEVLPSASDPTTAKVCRIYRDKKYQIRFWFDEKECVLTFEGTTYKPSSNFEKEIIKELQSIVNSGGQHDEVFHMNRALEVLNNYSNKEHKIGDIIEIRVPFIRTALPIEEFEFVIYDTPGSNSDNNVKHFEVLKDSLDEQTNALPVFLTTPDTMDAEDNDKILRLIEDTGAALDTTNAIVIVNKADEKGPKTLREKRDKCQNLRITKWKSTRIFFISSVIAIASKKNNPDDASEWLDEDMFEIYDEKESKYVSDERKLFEFNIVDKSKADDIVEYMDSDKTTHLYKNSGLEAVEREIAEYARRYARYNKCQQASAYLQDAIDLCVENIQETEEELSKALQEARGHFDSKKKALCDKLEDKKNDTKIYNTEFQEKMNKDFESFIKEHHLLDDSSEKRILQEEFKAEWKRLKEIEKKEKKDKSWTFSQIQLYADKKYDELLISFSKLENPHIDSFWNKKSAMFKEDCRKIVHDSNALTDVQKYILRSVVLSNDNMSISKIEFDLRKSGAIRKKKIIIWERKSEKFDDKKCCEELVRCFGDAVRKSISKSVGSNEEQFKKWTDKFINTLIEKLCKFNSELSSFEQKIEKLEKTIQEKKKCEMMLRDSQKMIDNLLEIQGGEENG